MSAFTVEQLAASNLVGFGKPAWWSTADLRERIAAGEIESPFYDDAIPLEDITRRLFNFETLSFAAASIRPMVTGWDGPTYFDADGIEWRVVIDEDRQAVGPDDTDDTFGVFKLGYNTENHQYGTLVDWAADLIGPGVGVGAAGTLSNRAVAHLSLEVPEAVNLPTVDLAFRPRLLLATSWDGTLARTARRCFTLDVCDNTLSMGLAEGAASGHVVKVKHTKNSGVRLSDARSTLGLLDQMSTDIAAGIERMAQAPITERQWQAVLDVLVPVPTGDDATQRGITRSNNRRDEIDSLYRNDSRCSLWQGSQWGAFQTWNTYDQHLSTVRGETHRADRNMSNVIRGKSEASDNLMLDAMTQVGILVAA